MTARIADYQPLTSYRFPCTDKKKSCSKTDAKHRRDPVGRMSRSYRRLGNGGTAARNGGLQSSQWASVCYGSESDHPGDGRGRPVDCDRCDIRGPRPPIARSSDSSTASDAQLSWVQGVKAPGYPTNWSPSSGNRSRPEGDKVS